MYFFTTFYFRVLLLIQISISFTAYSVPTAIKIGDYVILKGVMGLSRLVKVVNTKAGGGLVVKDPEIKSDINVGITGDTFVRIIPESATGMKVGDQVLLRGEAYYYPKKGFYNVVGIGENGDIVIQDRMGLKVVVDKLDYSQLAQSMENGKKPTVKIGETVNDFNGYYIKVKDVAKNGLIIGENEFGRELYRDSFDLIPLNETEQPAFKYRIASRIQQGDLVVYTGDNREMSVVRRVISAREDGSVLTEEKYDQKPVELKPGEFERVVESKDGFKTGDIVLWKGEKINDFKEAGAKPVVAVTEKGNFVVKNDGRNQLLKSKEVIPAVSVTNPKPSIGSKSFIKPGDKIKDKGNRNADREVVAVGEDGTLAVKAVPNKNDYGFRKQELIKPGSYEYSHDQIDRITKAREAEKTVPNVDKKTAELFKKGAVGTNEIVPFKKVLEDQNNLKPKAQDRPAEIQSEVKPRSGPAPTILDVINDPNRSNEMRFRIASEIAKERALKAEDVKEKIPLLPVQADKAEDNTRKIRGAELRGPANLVEFPKGNDITFVNPSKKPVVLSPAPETVKIKALETEALERDWIAWSAGKQAGLIQGQQSRNLCDKKFDRFLRNSIIMGGLGAGGTIVMIKSIDNKTNNKSPKK